MSGTQFLPKVRYQTTLLLTRGFTAHAQMSFPWGAPVAALSIGKHGNWSVMAEAVQDIHLYVAFDGRALVVAAATAMADVRINEQRIDNARWWPVPLPAVIQFGGATLQVECEDCSVARSSANLPDGGRDQAPGATVSDGGELREQARQLAHARAVVAAAKVPSHDGGAAGTPNVAWNGANVARPAPAPVAPPGKPSIPSEPGARVLVPNPSLPAPALGDGGPPQLSQWQQTSGVKKAILLLLPVAAAATLYSMREDLIPVKGVSTQSTSAALSTASVRAPNAAAAGMAAVGSPASAGVSSAVGAPGSAGVSSAVGSAPDRSAVPSADATPNGSGPAVSSQAREAVNVGKRSSATPATTPANAARAALDAAFEGRLDEASRRYAELSDSTPSEPAYRLAARLVKDHAVRRP